MKKIALVLAALAATSGAAFANDFAATLHYPEAPRVDQAATQQLDHTSTGSILRKLVSGKAATDSKTVSAPVADASNN
jgi:hypothetical protein